MSLFQFGEFILHSGQHSCLKIDCDALKDEDWKALAAYTARHLPPFRQVVGVPTGGFKFAKALRRYQRKIGRILVVDDVLTTGASMRETMANFPREDVIGLVLFARGECPAGVGALAQWTVTPERERP